MQIGMNRNGLKTVILRCLPTHDRVLTWLSFHLKHGFLLPDIMTKLIKTMATVGILRGEFRFVNLFGKLSLIGFFL